MAKKVKQAKLAKKYTFSLLQISIFILIFAVLGVYALTQSFAATKGGAKQYPATVTVTITPIVGDPNYSHMDFTGCGYYQNAGITNVDYKLASASGGWAGTNAGIDANGCLVYDESSAIKHQFSPGTYDVEVLQRVHSKYQIVAKNTFVVE